MFDLIDSQSYGPRRNELNYFPDSGMPKVKNRVEPETETEGQGELDQHVQKSPDYYTYRRAKNTQAT